MSMLDSLFRRQTSSTYFMPHVPFGNLYAKPILRSFSHKSISILARYPRLNRESLLPIVKHVDPALLMGSKKSENYDRPPVDLSGWYPPGHGDVYRRFCESGLAEKMRKAGKEWIFISNIDNLGACVDLSRLTFSLYAQSRLRSMLGWLVVFFYSEYS